MEDLTKDNEQTVKKKYEAPSCESRSPLNHVSASYYYYYYYYRYYYSKPSSTTYYTYYYTN